MMDQRPCLAGVDWGTSSFRLWLFGRDGMVLAERRSAEGMSTLKPDQFEAVLYGHLSGAGGEGLPVILCGMVGAKQGWREAGYVDVPADLRAITAGTIRVDGAGRDARILPGLAQRQLAHPDVMRGEETQLLGLLRDWYPCETVPANRTVMYAWLDRDRKSTDGQDDTQAPPGRLGESVGDSCGDC